jgi:hypothetical protein
MTAKRDLKRRVRQRQARTGESYVTARRRVLAARNEPTGRDDSPDGSPAKSIAPIELREGDELRPALPVVELRDVTQEAWQLGYRCRITVFPSVLDACELADVLAALRDALVGSAGDPGRARMFGVAFGLPSKPPLALLPEPYRGPAELVFAVVGRTGAIDIRCRMWPLAPSLMLRRADESEHDMLDATPEALVALRARTATVGTARFAAELFGAVRRTLFVTYRGRGKPILGNTFVIGRDPKLADLAISDDEISRAHAAVIRRDGAYYLKDLGSTTGIHYKGMQIDNKRIDDGDVFHLAGHELRFTFRPG